MKTIAPPTIRVRLHVDLFAYTLTTLAYGWMVMNLLQGWKVSLGIQTGIILVSSLLWTLFGTLFMHWLKLSAMREAQETRELHDAAVSMDKSK